MVSEYVRATSVEEAARLSAQDPAATVMGGGTTLMPRFRLGDFAGERVIGLSGAGLDYVRDEDGTAIGAMTPLGDLAGLERLPIVASAARSIGGWALRTTATIGGNLFVDPPYGDLAPALLAVDAELVIQAAAGTRRVSLADALTEDQPLGAGEILAEVVVPPTRGATAHRRIARRAANSPAVVAVGARVHYEGDEIAEARVALGAVAPRAFRATAAEEALLGSAGDEAAIEAAAVAAAEAAEPADDPVASAWYRRRMTAVGVTHALRRACGKETT